jgi:two-component system response regulator HydG
MYQLTQRAGRNRGMSWALQDEPVIIGREEGCSIRVDDHIVSRRHCEVRRREGVIYLRDLGSSNGTFVNDEPVREALLSLGDEIRVGSHVFVLTQSSSSGTPEPLEDAGEASTITVDLDSAYYVRHPSAAPPAPEHPRGLDDLRELFSLSRRFSDAPTVAGLVDMLASALRGRFQPDAFWLATAVHPDGGLVFYPMEGAPPADGSLRSGLRRALDGREGVLVSKTLHGDAVQQLETTLIAPLVTGEQPVGAMAVRVATPRRVYDESDLEFFVALAHTFAPCLRAAERNEQVRRDLLRLQANTGVTTRIIGESPPIRETVAQLTQAARTGLNVLLWGETGSGKELAARLVHDASARAEGPFVAVNCAAIPWPLFESEIFGHEKGAFTGAVRRRIGRFEEAHGGTLFLDEVSELPAGHQSRLLRVLETGTFYRVGGERELHASVRIVAATNRDLPELMASGAFREDLYHRLSGFEVRLPPLRERRSDIPLLAQHFLDSFRAHTANAPTAIAPAAIEKLVRWHWPGNVRELKACIERAAAVARTTTILPEDILLLHAPSAPSGETEEPLSLAEVEKRHIDHVLRVHRGNITAAALALGISRPTLYAKIREYGLDVHS